MLLVVTVLNVVALYNAIFLVIVLCFVLLFVLCIKEIIYCFVHNFFSKQKEIK